ncbi:MAG: beta-galactosidase trimerization domain-containing protein [Phycisphaerae bacterium]
MPGIAPSDPFLHAKIEALHDTALQRKFRKLAPLPVGAVFLPWPGMTEADARQQFRTMKELGFTCLKQTVGTPEWPAEKILHIALDEGLWPFWYAEGGFADITPELLTQLGLPADMEIDAALAHPKVLAHQRELIRQRIGRPGPAPVIPHMAKPHTGSRDATWVPGMVDDFKGYELDPESVPEFVRWLEQTYGSVTALQTAWNAQHVGLGGRQLLNWQDWVQVEAGIRAGFLGHDYRRIRDVLRFRADRYLQRVTQKVQAHQQIDPDEPIRAGGEMGLFLPFAYRGMDMEGVAEAMAEGGSFYPSMHLAWHFEEVAFEVVRPVYMQSQIAADWAKGIWTATWESTGGPQFFSGGKSPFVEETRNTQPGFTTDENTITQLMLSWLAAGFKGFGLWTWNARTAGWEAGEYALLDRNRNVTPRAIQAGAIGKAAVKYRRELWNAHKEPLVGVLQDWENDAIWAAMAVSGRTYYRTLPVRARIGVSRALINANIPWEYVTPRNLQRGLGPRYRIIYVPAFIALSAELQKLLHDYVQAGGRVVLDLPGAYFDGHGVVFNTDRGSVFEQTFGVVLNEFHYANDNTPYSINGVNITPGFTAQLTPTTARVLAKYGEYDRPAITEAQVGKGTAVIIAAQASLNCYRPGNEDMEHLLVANTLGAYRSPFACPGALVYRLASPTADHYFLINDNATTTVTLDTKAYHYTRMTDAVTGVALDLGSPLTLAGHSGRWLRLEK